VDLRVAITGHVDHGKSTLIGRMLFDTGSLPDGKAEEIEASSRRRGLDATEWSFAVDAAQEERDQAITIETTRVWMQYAGRRIVIIDTPGHREFIRNMMSGAADADAAILVVDAVEGIRDQTHRHAYLLQLLDVPEIIVAVNKIDALENTEQRFAELSADIRKVLAGSGKSLRAIVPISARDGDNVLHRSERTAWYDGPTVIEALAGLSSVVASVDHPTLFTVQDVYRFDEERIAVGRLAGGSIAVGDRVRLAPSGAVTRVQAVKRWPEDGATAHAGDSVGLMFADPVFVDRGDVIAAADAPPVPTTTSFDGVFFWLAHEAPEVGETLQFRVGTAEVGVTIAAIDERIDLGMLDREQLDDSPRHAAFALRLKASRTVAAAVGARCVLLRNGLVVGGGKLSRVDAIAMRANADVFAERHLVRNDERTRRNGYRGSVVWFTGLPSSGKSTLSMAVERELFARGYFVYVLDGDNVRLGLNADLGFSRESRRENIRRVGEVAALFADAGAIVIASTVSPFAEDRATARAAAKGAFHEIYVKASVATCETRDRKGLYKRARAGEIPDFTGVSAPYEAPEKAELVVETDHTSIDESVQHIVHYLLESIHDVAEVA
jgi:bifunctional enzyme CysN/CysC